MLMRDLHICSIIDKTRKMVPIKGRAKVKLSDVHALCSFDVRKESFS